MKQVWLLILALVAFLCGTSDAVTSEGARAHSGRRLRRRSHSSRRHAHEVSQEASSDKDDDDGDDDVDDEDADPTVAIEGATESEADDGTEDPTDTDEDPETEFPNNKVVLTPPGAAHPCATEPAKKEEKKPCDGEDKDKHKLKQVKEDKAALAASRAEREKKMKEREAYELMMQKRDQEAAEIKSCCDRAKKELADNRREQADLKTKMDHYRDLPQSNGEIEANEKIVANETQSAALATMMGNMWKEMRMFSVPFYTCHLRDELKKLQAIELNLQKNVEECQARLAKKEKEWAAEDAALKQKEEAAKDEDDDDEDDTEGAAAAGGEAGGESGTVKEVEEMGTWWERKPGHALLGTIVYVILGIVAAFIYWKIRDNQAFALKQRVPYNQVPAQDFYFSLFGCFGQIPICLMACCCPCIRWAHTMDSARIIPFSYWIGFLVYFILMVLIPYTYGLCGLLLALVGFYGRIQIRVKYQMAITPFTYVLDCATWCCCQPCAIAQEAKETLLQVA